MIRGAATRSVRGKCRFCCSSVSRERYGWAGEQGGPEPYECVAAPPVTCPPCDGLGRLRDEEESRRLGRDVLARCECCRGRGEVPGPHWPWRHPATAL